MDKAKSKRHEHTAGSLKSEVEKAVANPGAGGQDKRVWVRDDGAVCFGDECVTIKPESDGALRLEIHPDSCGEQAGSVIIDHLIKSAGKGVHIVIPASETVIANAEKARLAQEARQRQE
jgi:hypothetical protein